MIKKEAVDGPDHYGGADNPFEVIKVLRAWGFFGNAMRFNSIKYLARAGRKDDLVEDLRKAIYYVRAEIENLGGHDATLEKAVAKARRDGYDDGYKKGLADGKSAPTERRLELE